MNSEETPFYPTITIQNFKIFQEEVSFRLKPITILVGPNGGGKSTIIEALEFFLHSLATVIAPDQANFPRFDSLQFSDIACAEYVSDTIILSSTISEALAVNNSDTVNVSVDKNAEIYLHPTVKLYLKNSNEKIIIDRLDISIENEKLRWMATIYPNKVKYNIEKSNWMIDLMQSLNQFSNYTWAEYLKNEIEDYKAQKPFSWSFDKFESNGCFDVKLESTDSFFHESYDYIFKILLGAIFYNIRELGAKDLSNSEKQKLFFQVVYYLYKDNHLFFDKIKPKEFTESFEMAYSSVQQIIFNIREHINEFRLWEKNDETRENPPSVFEYKSEKIKNDYYGLCSFMLTPVHAWSVYPEYQEVNKVNELNKILIDFDIADSVKLIEIATVSPNHKYYKINLVKGDVEFNIASLSSGGKQLIPIILSLIHNSSPGNNIAIKQPELHLHPKLQMKLADLICYNSPDLGNTWANYRIVETHSEHIIRRLQILVAKNKIRTDDIGILYVSNDEVKNYSRLIKLEMDERGLFTTPWPNGFFEESSTLNIQLIEEILKRTN